MGTSLWSEQEGTEWSFPVYEWLNHMGQVVSTVEKIENLEVTVMMQTKSS